MKKTNHRHPSSNPFYEDVQRNGIVIDVPLPGEDPTRRSTNPYYDRIIAAGGVQIASGRPRRGEKARPTIVKSVRLPPAIWKSLSAQAKREKITLNAAIRQAALIWLRS